MEHVKTVIFRLLTMTGVAAALAFGARLAIPEHGAMIAETIGLSIALIAVGVLIISLRTVNEKVVFEGMAEKEVMTQRFMASGLVSYVVGVPVTLGLHLANILPWIGVVVYAGPLAVAMVVALASRRPAPAGDAKSG